MEEGSFPPGYVERMRRMLGTEEASEFLAALGDRLVGLRVNFLKVQAAEFRSLSPFELEPLPYPEGGYLVRGECRPGKHPYHSAGLYYLQDPGAMTVGAVLSPRPGERVLDISAAPGGKATHVASLLGGEGLLVANDVAAPRARELAGNLERFGVRNAVVTTERPERLAAAYGPFFDRVVVDAPCSGESMFPRSEAARREWSDAAVQGCARRQADLLRAAGALVRPGGLLLYSTCTFSPEENEGAVAAFLRADGRFEVEALDPVPGAAPGRADWMEPGAAPEAIARTVRLWPHRVPGAGHYMAGLRRNDEGTPPPGSRTPRPSLAAEARGLVEAFARETLACGFDTSRLSLRGEELFAIPEGAPETAVVRVLRPGWHVGAVLRNRFEPAHALAMALTPDQVTDAVLLGLDDLRTHAYLRGETIESDGPPGWTLVAVSGFPLGWGKRVGRTIKNHLPKGLRWK